MRNRSTASSTAYPISLLQNFGYDYIIRGLSKGEFQSVLQAVGNLDDLIDKNCKDEELLVLIRYIVPEDRIRKVLENQTVLKQPVVRNGRRATVGYAPEIWKDWD